MSTSEASSSSSSSSSSDRIRITARLNGDDSSAGKVVSVNRTDSLSTILTTVSSRLADDILKAQSTDPTLTSSTFTHVFAVNGAEVTHAEDIRNDEILFFALNEKFIPIVGSGENESGNAGTNVAKKQFLHQIASSAVAQALQIYDSTSAFVKARSPSVVATTLNKLEEKAKEIASNPSVVHAVTTAGTYAEPAVNWADSKLDVVYDRVRIQSNEFLDSERVKQVNALLLEPVKARIITPADHFYSQLKESYLSLDKSGTGSVSLDDFKNGVKTRLGSEWSERLVEPLTHFYSVVKNEFETAAKTGVDRLVSVKENAGTNVSQAASTAQDSVNRVFTAAKAKLGAVWENSVKENLSARKEQAEELLAAFNSTVQSKVKEPVQAFVSSAFESYRALLATSTDNKVTPAEFIAGMRVKLHAVWSDKLVPHAQQLYQILSQKFEEQKQKLAGTNAAAAAPATTTATTAATTQ